MKINNEDLTRITYIESVLGIKFNGTTSEEVVKFIQENLVKARKFEPTYHDLVNGRTFL